MRGAHCVVGDAGEGAEGSLPDGHLGVADEAEDGLDDFAEGRLGGGRVGEGDGVADGVAGGDAERGL